MINHTAARILIVANRERGPRSVDVRILQVLDAGNNEALRTLSECRHATAMSAHGGIADVMCSR